MGTQALLIQDSLAISGGREWQQASIRGKYSPLGRHTQQNNMNLDSFFVCSN